MNAISSKSELWPEVELGEVCEFAYGKSLPAKTRTGSGFPVFGSNGQVGLHEEALTTGKTIIIGRKGSFGEVHYSNSPCSPIDTTYFITQEQTKAYLPWLARRLRRLNLNQLNRAAAIPGLNRTDAYRQKLLLPPLAEQKRIAAILDAADALRAKRRESLEQIDTLLQSTFLEMFGDPATNPMGWAVQHIGDIAEVKGGKRLPKGDDYSSEPTPYRYIRVCDLKPNHIQISNLQYLHRETQAQISRYIVTHGDVIISIAGTIGVTAAVPYELSGTNLTENAAKIVFNDQSKLEPIFISYALQTTHLQNQIVGQTGQVTIGKLALFRIRNLLLPLPPLRIQQRFAAIVESVEQQKASQRKHLEELDTLFASLQQRAFSGEL